MNARGAQRRRNGSAATRCATRLPRSAGSSRTRRTGKNSAANSVAHGTGGASFHSRNAGYGIGGAPFHRTGSRRFISAILSRASQSDDRKRNTPPFPSMTSFAPRDYLDLEHTAHRMLFEKTTNVWEVLGKTRQLSPVQFAAGRAGRTGRQTVHRAGRVRGRGDDHRTRRDDQRPGVDRRELPRPQRLLRARERHRRRRRGAGQFVRVQELPPFRRRAGAALQLRGRLDPGLSRATSARARSFPTSSWTTAKSPSRARTANASPAASGSSARCSATMRRSAAMPCSTRGRSSGGARWFIPAHNGAARCPRTASQSSAKVSASSRGGIDAQYTVGATSVPRRTVLR